MPTMTTSETPRSADDGNDDVDVISDLRIASLIPSATDICISLGLAKYVVGITHECDQSKLRSPPACRVLTYGAVDPSQMDQGAIHLAVQQQQQPAGVCPLPSSSPTPPPPSSKQEDRQQKQQDDDDGGDDLMPPSEAPPSLYPIIKSAFHESAPTVVLTQALCDVCAPSLNDVYEIVDGSSAAVNNEDDTTMTKKNKTRGLPVIVSLTPHSLKNVATTFVQVARACGVTSTGQQVADEFARNLDMLRTTIRSHIDARRRRRRPRVLLLEWVDPPFNGGHWIPDMIRVAGGIPATATNHHAAGADEDNNLEEEEDNDNDNQQPNEKSVYLPWDDVAAHDPDIVLVACCGFDLQRNIADTWNCRAKLLEHLPRACAQNHNRLYACDGDAYFAKPGPQLLLGTVIMALCIYEDLPELCQAIRDLPFVPDDFRGHEKVCLHDNETTKTDSTTSTTIATATKKGTPSISPPVADIEDDFHQLHEKACREGEMTYVDPSSGYQVFTELAHKRRGKCCGSGCRHCPYSHENVSLGDKIKKIQQPSFLYKGDDDNDHNNKTNRLFSLQHNNDNVTVLFWSGGKDSFLTIRALARMASGNDKQPFGLCLLTTYDATSKIIAHQDVHMDVVVRQAQHLGVALVGVAMHRQSSEGYVGRVRRGLDVIEQYLESTQQQRRGDAKDCGKPTQRHIKSIAFGDLHLRHVIDWRERELRPLEYNLLYPLYETPYDDLLRDLERSNVPCIISSSTLQEEEAAAAAAGANYSTLNADQKGTNGDKGRTIHVGDVFGRELVRRIKTLQLGDSFGENGEFHSVAQVWHVDREIALGIRNK